MAINYDLRIDILLHLRVRPEKFFLSFNDAGEFVLTHKAGEASKPRTIRVPYEFGNELVEFLSKVA